MAKIVTFNFSLKPVESKGSSSALKNEDKKAPQQSSSEFTNKRPIAKPY